MTAHSTYDTASLSSRISVNQTHWETLFVERIYQICSSTHPGMAIELDAVHHIKDIIGQIVVDLLDLKASSVVEMDRGAQRLFPKTKPCQMITKEAWESMYSYVSSSSRRFHTGRFRFMKSTDELQHKMVGLLKESMGIRKDREKEKEIEKMAVYVIAVCEYITEDILTWTGNYVKHIRNGDRKISLQNLKIALNADVNLMELTSSLNNDDDDANTGSFLSNFYEYDLHDSDEEHESVPKSATYESIANEFLKDERLYLRELNQANVFRRRLEEHLRDEDRALVKLLFGNIGEIHELTLKMERTLEDAIEMSEAPCIGMGLWELAEAYEFDGYLSYLMRGRDDEPEQLLTTVIDHTINELLTNNKFAALFENEERGYANTLDGQTFRLAVKYVLPNLLHAPVLHFIRYVEYTNKLLRYSQSEEDRSDLQNCKRYLTSVSNKMESSCSQIPRLKSMIKMEQSVRNDSRISQLSRLQEIERSIDGFEGNPIGKTCSELVKEGQLDMVRPSLTVSPEVSRKGRWKTHRYLFLFDQLLVMCKKYKTHKFKDRTPVQLMDVVDLEDGNVIRHAFRLDIREKAGSSRSYTLICASHDDKFEWMSGLVMVTTRSLIDRILDGHEKEEAKRIPLVTPGADQYRFAEPDCEENISFEDYTSSSGIPVVKTGTVLKLVERLTYHQYTDNKFVQTFLISYRSFCTPSELLELLMERFNVPIPNKLQHSQDMRGGPLAGRFDTVQSHGLSGGGSLISAYHEQSYQRFRKEYERPIQRRVLSVLLQWVKNHWYDFDSDPALLEAVEKFLLKSMETHGKLTNQHKKFCKNILSQIEKLSAKSAGPFDGSHGSSTAFDWDDVARLAGGAPVNSFQPKKPETLWHAAKKGDVSAYDLLTLHPLEIGRQLTMLHFDLYRAIKPIELIGAAWTKHDKYRRSPQLLRLTDHSTLLSYWVSRSIVETDSLEERVAMFNRVLEVMSVFEELHNFTGLVAFLAALQSSCVHRLTACWERLDHEKQKCYDRFQNLCEPRWQEMQKRLQTINPPCVPFFGHYLSNIFFFEAGNSTFVKSPNATSKEVHRPDLGDPQSPSYSNKRVLVSFLKCRRISDLIREIQMYQNQPYALHPEPSIRQFFESINPKSDFNGDGDALETYLYDRSLKIQPKDADKAPDVKPKRSAHVLKSPGVKAPKSNHYSSSSNHTSTSYSTQTSTVPSTPDGPRSALLTPPSDDLMTVDSSTLPHQHNRFAASADATTNRRHFAPPLKIGQLQPPPLHPRRVQPPPSPSARTASATLPPPPPSSFGTSGSAPPSASVAGSSSTSAPPPLHPRRAQQQPFGPVSPPLASAKSPPTPVSAARTSSEPSPTFVFPPIAPHPSELASTGTSSPPPELPPRKSADGMTSSSRPARRTAGIPIEPVATTSGGAGGQEQLRVVLDRPSCSPTAHSPTVCLSVPLPPALPPRRGAHKEQAPPPIPPKTSRYSASPNGVTDTPSTSSPSNQATPPLPTAARSSPSSASTSTQSFVTASDRSSTMVTPPPLPPKTYKRKQSVSPPTVAHQ